MFARIHGYVGFALAAAYAHVMVRPRTHAAGGVVLLLIVLTLVVPPLGFPSDSLLDIPKNQSFGVTAHMLEEQHVVTSAFVLKALARVTGADNDIQAGTYALRDPQGVVGILWRLATGDTDMHATRVTFPEGSASFDMAHTLETKLPGFDATTFNALAVSHEGYLFPDTYDFAASTSPQEAIDRMLATYAEKRKAFADDIAASGHTEQEVIVMASIVEREAATPEDRRIVAGILWQRITVGMRLQVDAPFAYEAKDWSYLPTQKDLDTDTKYNTYRNDGLPPMAIGNPGLDAIEATLHPTETDYLYYLTGTDGAMHYAETFEDHKANKDEYLK